MSEKETDFLTFVLDRYSFAIPVQNVEKVERAVEITRVPDSGELLHGVIDYHGALLSVINLRKKFALAPQAVTIDQKLLIVNTYLRQLAILVDDVGGVTKIAEKEIFEAKAVNDSSAEKTEKKILLFNNQKEIFIIYEMEELLAGDLDKEINQMRELLSKED